MHQLLKKQLFSKFCLPYNSENDDEQLIINDKTVFYKLPLHPTHDLQTKRHWQNAIAQNPKSPIQKMLSPNTKISGISYRLWSATFIMSTVCPTDFFTELVAATVARMTQLSVRIKSINFSTRWAKITLTAWEVFTYNFSPYSPCAYSDIATCIETIN